MNYLRFMSSVHRLLAPQRYLEVGVRHGGSLALARCKSVGIDPAFSITTELNADVSLFRTTSDEYFARAAPLEATDGEPFDLAFIDGLHLFEFALRDFMNAERLSRSTSVIVFDDMLPRTVAEAARERHTKAWTGDVYSVIEVLARYRPEVSTILVDTAPTGLMVVTGLDPASRVLSDHYSEIVAEFRRQDPQPVPQQILDRSAVQQPERVLAAGFWSLLRDQGVNPRQPDFHARLARQLEKDFGPAYARSVA